MNNPSPGQQVAEDPDQLFDTPHAEKLFAIPEGRLRQLRSEGKGPRYVRLPGTRYVRYRRADLRDWISEGSTP